MKRNSTNNENDKEEIFLSEKLELINKCINQFEFKLSTATELKNQLTENLTCCNNSRNNLSDLESGTSFLFQIIYYFSIKVLSSIL
jgi:hypothetical protein